MTETPPSLPDPSVWRRVGLPPALRAVRSVMQALEESCAHPAGAVALAGNAGRIGRAELIDRVRRVAAHVQRRVPPGRVVAAMLPQSPDGVAALLGCAAAGRICVALNTADPPERQAVILGDSAAAAVLFDDAAPDAAPTVAALPAGAAPIALSDCLAQSAPPIAAAHDPDAPCMVHYTSGSTGRPKGIVLSSYAMLTRAEMGVSLQSLGPADRFMVATSISDASSVAAVLAALLGGATKLVVSLPREGVGGMLRLAAREHVTVLSGTAALLRALRNLAGAAEAVSRVRLLRVGGTGLPADDLALWRGMLPAGCEISHAYASTEALLVSEWRIPPDHAQAGAMLGVGRMLPGIEHALLDPDGRPVADGEPGEMLIRGRHVALGEWRDGAVVPGRMAPDPTRPGTRVFRTGDLLRFDADGVLHFVGRADRQVKVNGVRIELGEIEAVLRAEPGVRDAAVVQAADGALHGFVAAEPDAALPRRLNARLRAALPPAMRPRRIAVLAALPLLASAKHDLDALRRLADG